MSDSEPPPSPPPSSSSKTAEKEKPSDSFKAKHKEVFSFDEVKIKSTGEGLEKNANKTSKLGEDVSKFRGKESMFREDDDRSFKKPSRPGSRPYEPPRNRRVPYEESHLMDEGRRDRGGRGGAGRRAPDFRLNPDKYTKYSLADVDMPTNTSNSQAAFAFLDEVRKRKASGSTEDEVPVQEGAKFTFKKPTRKHAGREKVDEDTAHGGDAELVQPAAGEGAVEHKSKDSLKDRGEVKEKKGKKSKQMALSHLMDEEHEEDE